MADPLPIRRRWRRRFWYDVTRLALATVAVLPEGAGRRCCRTLAAWAPRLRTADAELARTNVALAWPDRSPAWRSGLLDRHEIALGDTLHATLTLPREAARGFPSVVEEPGPDGRGAVDVIRDLLGLGRGVMVVTAHLGCWELLGAWLANGLGSASVITGTVRNPSVDRLLQDRRRALGMRPLPREAGARPLLRALDDGQAVGVLLDQNTGAASVEAPFLGHPAPTPVGPLRLARRRNVPLLPAAAVRENGRWVVRWLPVIEPAEAADDEQLAARCNDALGALIARNPEQWVWFHDRWAVAGKEQG